MRVAYTTILSTALAASALAFPFRGGNQKRDEVVEVVTECTTVITTEFVTVDPAPATPTPTPSSTPTPDANPIQSKDNGPTPQVEYSKVWTFTKSHKPQTSPPPAPETTPTPVVTTPPVVQTPTPIPTPSTSAPVEPVITTPPVAGPTTTPPAPVATTAPAADSSFESQILQAHNDKRALHGVPALTYDTTMATFAASVCSSCVFKHSGGSYGENLAAGYSTPAAAIQAWYDEVSQYNYAAGQFSSATGHFTQMVWKAATKVGCAVKSCSGTNGTPGDFLTCNYDTGNVIGEFVANVLPPV